MEVEPGIFLPAQSGYMPIIISGQNLSECWLNALKGVFKYGTKRWVEAPEYKTWQMDAPIFIHCVRPHQEPFFHPGFPLQPGQAEEYAKNFIHGMSADKENAFDYTYYSRFRKYWDCPMRAELPSIIDDPEKVQEMFKQMGSGRCMVQQIDQVQKAIDTLKADPTRRSVVLISWIQIRDLEKFGKRAKSSSPCITLIQPQIIDKALHIHVLMKTNDLFNAWPLNAYGLIQLQKYMAQQIGVGVGSYTHFSVSMNIYEDVFEVVEGLIK